MRRVLLVILAAAMFVVWTLAPAVAGAKTVAPQSFRPSKPRTAVAIAPGSGPPTTTVSVKGSGFGDQEAVDIYFDTRDRALAATNSKGSFKGIKISVPASATPGSHWVTLVGRRTGRAAQTRFVVRTDWAQFGFSPSHSHYNPFENVLRPSNVAGLGLAWSYTTSSPVYSSPAVAHGVVYVSPYHDGKVYALHASTGHKLWSYTTGGPTHSSPAVASGVVYVGSESNMYALDASTGHKLWSYTTGDIVYSSPAVAHGVVYFGSDDHKVYALNAATGQKLWSYTTGGPVLSSPAVAHGVVYFGSLDGNMYALEASSGHKLWSYTTGGPVYSSPAVANGVVYFGATDDFVYALNASTGEKLWSYVTGNVYSSPAVGGGIVYVTGGLALNGVYALDASTGQKLWSLNTGLAVGSSPAVANGVVYVGWAGKVYALDASTGEKLWFFSSGLSIDSSPAVANGKMYVGSDDERLYAFDLATNPTEKALARSKASRLKPNRSLRPSKGTT